MRENHDAPTAAHLGNFKTRCRILERCYWPGMRTDIAKYVAKCPTCLETKPDGNPVKGLMGKQVEVSEPWEVIATDIMGPFPPSSNQNRYLVVVADYLTKYCLLLPVRKVTGKTIVKFLKEQVFLVYGVPRVIICDNGPQYTSGEFRSFLKPYGVKLSYNALYHPQHNPVERINKVLRAALGSCVSQNHRTWDKNLPEIGFALRTAVHESTGYAPTFLNFGRQLKTSAAEYRKDGTGEPIDDTRDNLSARLKELEAIRMEAVENLQKAYCKNRKAYDLRRREETLSVGDTVWKRTYAQSDATRHFSAKLVPRYQQARVARVISPRIYDLEDIEGSPLGRWHIKDLKLTQKGAGMEIQGNAPLAEGGQCNDPGKGIIQKKKKKNQ
ncbi:hypothetical protein AAG570_008408 [Ranatra chinensis]|uniref:RNA-directed DNA polymerase n=1 Tax=Ranatra chinensis TaxID=642074 RepID=A0ABD0ZE50_9HEMI